MKDVYEVLRQKEIDLARVRQEVDALELIIPLIQENGDNEKKAGEVASNRDSAPMAQSRY
jgi:hypothetical protein